MALLVLAVASASVYSGSATALDAPHTARVY